MSSLLAGNWWSVCISKSQRNLLVSRTNSGVCMYIRLYGQILIYCKIFRRSSPPNQAFFCIPFVLACFIRLSSVFALILMALFCTAIKRDSVPLLRFYFLSVSTSSRVQFPQFVSWSKHFCFLDIVRNLLSQCFHCWYWLLSLLVFLFSFCPHSLLGVRT